VATRASVSPVAVHSFDIDRSSAALTNTDAPDERAYLPPGVGWLTAVAT